MTRIQYPVFAIIKANDKMALSNVDVDGEDHPCILLFEDADVASATGNVCLQEFTLRRIENHPELVKLLLCMIEDGVYHAYVMAKQEGADRALALLELLTL